MLVSDADRKIVDFGDQNDQNRHQYFEFVDKTFRLPQVWIVPIQKSKLAHFWMIYFEKSLILSDFSRTRGLYLG